MTQAVFCVLVGAVALQRLFELRISNRNAVRLKARGGREYAPEQVRWMALLHGAWLAAMPLEVLLAERPFDVRLACAALLVFMFGQALRLAAMRRLGERWCVRVITVPSEPVVRGGIFRMFKHPNYLGVVLELFALPMVHGAWVTALVASALNAALLSARIRVEEAALTRDQDYARVFERSQARRRHGAA